MFFKRLSRSRGNSYIDDDYERVSTNEAGRPPSSYTKQQQQQQQQQQRQGSQGSVHYDQPPPAAAVDGKDEKMYAARAQDPSFAPKETAYSSQRPIANGMSPRGAPRIQPTSDSYGDQSPMSPTKEHPSAPDLLTRAFHESVRPYTEKIEQLEQQLADMQEYLQSQEQQRMDIFAWIDKRGLRPDVPPTIAKQMDEANDSASALNAQLDRKITIVNFDLHRLQDDLNDSISSAHFASAMAKFLPDIQRLASLRTGPRFAYELIIKLVGNLNSHGGIEANGTGDDAEYEEDIRARSAFYDRMDDELVDVIKRRATEGEDWPVTREVKRLEKNGAFLKNIGIDSYFPRSLQVMRQEVEYRNPSGTPPRYS
ncbi:MAG: hypothetical protein M1828_006622 [Chrysothrix sp. TS-e1954]|nr:MAG: hypothetical protein M1828_006622 [Chrysothrix sp. TS-e1954]